MNKVMNKIKNWLTWKRFWNIHGYIQMGLWVMFIVVHNFPMAYSCSLAAMAFFGIAECKRKEK